MKILQITTASLGGIGRLTRDISDVLKKEHISSHIAYGRGYIHNPERDFMFGNKYDFLIHVLAGRINDAVGLYSKRGTKSLIQYIEQQKPDLIHLHNLHGYYINYQLLFNFLSTANIPVVWTLHDEWAFTGHCAYFENTQCNKWEQHCKHCPQIKEYPKSYIDKSFRNFDLKKEAFTSLSNLTIVTPSIWLQKLVKKSFLKTYNVQVINNGIDLNLFRIKDSKPTYTKKIVLGLASTWGERKGLYDFIKLSYILPEEYKIVLVGLKKKQLKLLPPTMKGIMHTESAEELVDIYNQAHIFVNPTYEDNFPTTNIEAMACGTSVITYPTGGSPESLTAETGYIVPKHDVKQIAQIIINHKKTPQTIAACRKRAELYDKNKAFYNYINLYKTILLNE